MDTKLSFPVRPSAEQVICAFSKWSCSREGSFLKLLQGVAHTVRSLRCFVCVFKYVAATSRCTGIAILFKSCGFANDERGRRGVHV